VRQFHLAGHTLNGEHLIDTHDAPIAEPVWALYATAVRHLGDVPALIERDGNIPELSEMMNELQRAERLREESRVHRDAPLTS
jgi:hypothetical protein